MKKVLVIIMLLALLLSFTGCALLDFASCVGEKNAQGVNDIFESLR